MERRAEDVVRRHAGTQSRRLFRGEQFTVLAKEPLNVFAAATGELLRTFLVSLERGETPPCNAADNRHTLALMLGAYESDAKRMPISMG